MRLFERRGHVLAASMRLEIAEIVGPMDLVILKKRAEFQRVRGGQRWSGRGFLAEGKRREAIPSHPAILADATRFGFTVSKKVGKAVERNRIKRRLKEALRSMPGEMAPAGTDIVVVARRPALDMTFAELTADVQAALTRLKSAGLKPDDPRREGKQKRQPPSKLPTKR